MDVVRESFIERFHPSNPNIPYIDYLKSISQVEMHEFFKWIRAKGRFAVLSTQSKKERDEIIETAKQFAMVSNELLLTLQTTLTYSDYNALVEMIGDDDVNYYIQSIVKYGVCEIPENMKSRVFAKMKAMGLDVKSA